MAWRIVRVTLSRAFSVGEPVRRGLPPRPVARLSSPNSASRSALRFACRPTSCRASASSSSSSSSARRFRYCLSASRSSCGPASPSGDRILAGCRNQRQGKHGFARSRNELAQMPEALEVGARGRSCRYTTMCHTPPSGRSVALLVGSTRDVCLSSSVNLLSGREVAHALGERKGLAQELRRRRLLSLLVGHPRDREQRRRHRPVHVANAGCAELLPELKRAFPERARLVENAARLQNFTHAVAGAHLGDAVAAPLR